MNITGRDKILLHLINQQGFKDTKGEVPYRICQRGIAEYVSLSRNRVSELLRDLVQKEKLDEITRRVVGLERRRKVYFLTNEGRKKARNLRDDLREKKVSVKVGEENEQRKVKLRKIDKYIETSDPLLSALNRMENDVIDLTEEEEEKKDVFVGRREEMKYLSKVLKKVEDEGSSTVFVTGPAGIGKTRLVSEFKEKVAKEGFEFLVGNAFYESAEPYRPLRSALEKYETLASMFRPEKIPEKQEIQDEESFDAERHAEWYEITQEMKEIAADRPLVVFLDDLQWSDRATLELLHYLSVEVDNPPVFFIGAYRPEDVDGDHPMQECKNRMIRENLFDELELSPLDWEDTKKIVKNQVGRKDITDKFVKLVHQTTEGNPLFIRESVTQMLEDGTIKPKKNEYPTSSDAIEIPDIVEAVIQRRVNRLSEDIEKILSKASVIGEKVPFNLLHKVTGLDEVELLDHLDVLVDTELIQDDPKEEVFSFSHTLIHLAVYEDISARVREGYHRVVGEKMAELYQDELEGRYSDLGYHYERGNEIGKAVEYYRKAGEEAKNVYAHEDAIEMYQKVLNLVGEHPEVELDRSDVLEGLGDTYKIIGEYKEAESSFKAALEETPKRERQQRLYRKMGRTLKEKGSYDEAQDIVEKGLSITEEKEVEKCRILGLKGEVLIRQGEYEKAIEIFNQEKELAERLGNPEEKAKALHDLGTIYLKKGDLDEGEDHLRRAVELREESEDLKALGKSLHNLAAIHIYKGEIDKALKYQGRSLAINEEMGNKLGLSGSLHNLGNLYLDKGDLEKALERYERSLEIRKEIGDKQGVAGSLNNIANLYLDKGDLENALEYHERSLDISEEIEDKEGIANSLNNMGIVYQYKGALDNALEYQERGLKIRKDLGDKKGIAGSLKNLGIVHLLKDDIDSALELLQKSLDFTKEIGEKKQTVENLCRLTEIWIEMDDLEKAERISEEGLEIAEEMDLRWEKGMCHMVRGMVYREKKRWEYSEEEFEKAIEILEEVGDQTEAARARYESGSMWKAKGKERKAEDRFKEALSMFEEIGMELWIRKTKEELS
ncbi:MAG: tetratricopeptide repeat protein [Candidatus Thermoplasmatota archaeon]